MCELSEITDPITKLDFHFMGVEINFDIRLMKLSNSFILSVTGFPDFQARILEKCVVVWDITEDGQTLPLTLENFSRLPMVLTSALMQNIYALLDSEIKSTVEANRIFYDSKDF